ncbi:helix-turn-helix transcriptional regulator [Emcibacter sp.]|uniref:helix-turn-helix domain-containing protein n=1 Tax=Emcibacter sp. TaxID=1979954 RepID=UPI002AA7B2D7|nr:helix-turn-helix transcriptional regulator [Emcibacter sp.]
MNNQSIHFAARDILARLDSGEEETIPFDMVEKLSRGEEHPLALWRKHRDLKAKELAEQAGISSVYLSDIENRRKPGTLPLFMKFSEILNVALDDLVDWPQD